MSYNRPVLPLPVNPAWEVVIPWGSETIRKTLLAEDKKKAFNKAVMQLASQLKLQPSAVFKRVYAERRYTVTQLNEDKMKSASSFMVRAHTPSIQGDLDRIQRLKLVEQAYLYEKNGSQASYRALLPKGNTLSQARELTGYLQNLFGARLLSSSPTQEVVNGETVSVIEVRVALMVLV